MGWLTKGLGSGFRKLILQYTSEVDEINNDTVDGRNPATVEVGSLSPLISSFFLTSQVVIAGFRNHQQY